MTAAKKELESKIVFTALRPPRAAIFIDNTDEKWKRTVLHLMEVLPSIWGADGFILIPSDGENIHTHFEELLRAYDPDFILTYQRTGYDLQVDDPTQFKKILDSYVDAFLKNHPDSDETNIREHHKKQLLRNALDRDFDLGKKIKQFVLKDLAVYHHGTDIRDQSITYSGSIPHFLPKLSDVIEHSERLTNLKIVELDLSNHATDFQLMGYGAAGKGNLIINNLYERRMELENLLPEIRRHRPDDVPETELLIQRLQKVAYPQRERFGRSDMSVMFKSIWNRQVDLDGIDFRSMFRSRSKKKAAKSDIYDFFTRVPFMISNLGLSYFFRRKDYLRDEQSNPLVIVGDTLDDYCLYYSLTRLRRKVYWLPYARLRKDAKKPNAATYSFILANELNHEGRESDEKEIHWTSLSLKKSQLSKVPGLLKKNDTIRIASYTGVADHLVNVNSAKRILPYLTRLYEKKNANNRSAYQFMDGKGINFVDTPMPKSFDAIDPFKHKWIAEISIVDSVYPTADFLSSEVFQATGLSTFHLGTTSTRVSRSGIHYQCPMGGGLISSSDDVSERLVRPMLNLISSQKIFEGYFRRKKLDIRLSDKGSYFAQVLKMFSSFDALSELIRNQNAFDLFELYCDLKKNVSGVFDKGVFLEAEKERYIDFASLVALLEPKHSGNAKTEAKKLVDSLIEKNLIERGYVFKCSYCKNCSWYKPQETTNTFTCKRCGSTNVIKEENLRVQAPDSRFEPLAFYKLNELFHQFWNSNGWLTALTLSQLKKNSDGSLIFLPETEFRKKPEQEKPDFEIDLLVIVDGSLYFGEAKRDANASNPKKKLSVEQIENLLGFDKFLPLKGLVFSSFSGNWSAQVQKKFGEIEKLSQYELIKLTDKELI